MNRSEKALLIIVLTILVFGIVGWLATPEDEKGQPILLLPSVKKIEDYRAKAEGWTEELRLLDGRLAVLMAGNSKSLFSQSQSSQDLFEDYVKLTQAINNAEAPSALTGLKDLLLNTSAAYLDASQSALRWVSTPSDDNLTATKELINNAQDILAELESNTWIKQN
jgi:hypothetical protein